MLPSPKICKSGKKKRRHWFFRFWDLWSCFGQETTLSVSWPSWQLYCIVHVAEWHMGNTTINFDSRHAYCQWDHLIGRRTTPGLDGTMVNWKEQRSLTIWAGCPSFLRGTHWVYSACYETIVHNRSAKMSIISWDGKKKYSWDHVGYSARTNIGGDPSFYSCFYL